MADIVRASLYIQSQKIVEVESSDLASKTNAERLHGQEGVLGASKGNREVDIRCNVIPTKQPSGAFDKLADAHRDQTTVQVVYRVGNRNHSMDCVVSEFGANSENRSGVVKGSFSLMNTSDPTEV